MDSFKVGEVVTWNKTSGKLYHRHTVRIERFSKKRVTVTVLTEGWDHTVRYHVDPMKLQRGIDANPPSTVSR